MVTLAQQKCDECDAIFTPTREWNRFCCDKCRFAHWNRERLAGIIKLTPENLVALSAIALAQGNTISDMGNRMLYRDMNPDRKPLEESDVHGK